MSIMEEDTIRPTSLMEAMVFTKASQNASHFTETGFNRTTPSGVDEAETGFSTADLIILTTTPGIVVFGTIGNILCALVLFRAKFRSVGINMYLIALAAADTTFLWTNSMTRNFIKLNFGMDYSTVSTQACEMYVFLLYTSKCLSAWFTIAVTIERLIVVLFPYKAKSICTRKRALLAIAFVTFIISGTYSFIPFVYDIVWREDKMAYRCEMRRYYKEFKQTDVILKTLDLLIYSLLPTVILSVSNTILIYKLVQSAKFRAESTTQRSSEQDNMARRLTITLTLVSGCFLIFTVPMSSFLLHAQIHTSVDNFEIYYRSFYVLELLNSAVNFLLYCGSGPTFRKEVKEMVKGLCDRCSCKKIEGFQSRTSHVDILRQAFERKGTRLNSNSNILAASNPKTLDNAGIWTTQANGEDLNGHANVVCTEESVQDARCNGETLITRL